MRIDTIQPSNCRAPSSNANGSSFRMYADARKAYDVASRTAVSSRELEAHALHKAARLLETSIQESDSPAHRERFDEALRYNQKLWTFFQAELTDETNPLPRDLR